MFIFLLIWSAFWAIPALVLAENIYDYDELNNKELIRGIILLILSGMFGWFIICCFIVVIIIALFCIIGEFLFNKLIKESE